MMNSKKLWFWYELLGYFKGYNDMKKEVFTT